MIIRSLCLGPVADAPALRAAVQSLLRATPGLSQAQSLRVLRHIPTDSVPDSKAHTGVTREADEIQAVLELYFEGEPPAAGAWGAFVAQLQATAPILFFLDSRPNVPIAPRAGAVSGGFRRWMLLARKAETQEQFRDAWFGRHASLVKELPQVDGYLQNLVTRRYDSGGQEVGYTALPVDGIAELCFADEAAMNASYASDARLPLRDDGRNLLGRITTLLVHGEAISCTPMRLHPEGPLVPNATPDKGKP